MKIAGLFRASLGTVALNLLVTFSGVSQSYVLFDSADSNPRAGIYSFLFSGVSLDMGAPYQLSDFTLSGFQAAGNMQTLGFVSGPTAWPMISSDTYMMHYQCISIFHRFERRPQDFRDTRHQRQHYLVFRISCSAWLSDSIAD
jgi:hypothetical protein